MNNLEYVQDVQTEGQLYKEKQGEKYSVSFASEL